MGIKHTIYLFLLIPIVLFCKSNNFYIPFSPHNINQTESAAYAHINMYASKSYKSDYAHRNHHNLFTYSVDQLKDYFTRYNFTQKEILSQTMLYLSDEFVTLAKTHPGYEQAIVSFHKKIRTMHWFIRSCKIAFGFHSIALEKRIEQLYSEIQHNKQTSNYPISVNTSYNTHNKSYNCQNQLIWSLESKSDKNDVATSLDLITQETLNKAFQYNHPVHTQIEDALDISLAILKHTDNEEKFIFHTAFINHILCDIEGQLLTHTNQKQTLIERSPTLLARALKTFVKALNPVTQATNACEFLISTAHFFADVTLGKLYLSQEQYQQRIDNFWSSCEALSPSNLAKLDAEQWTDLAAQFAADCIFFGGVVKTVAYLKEIEAISKAHQQAARITQKLKNAIDASLAQHPLLVTAEGLIFRATDEMQHLGGAAKEVITNSQMLLKSTCKGLLADLEKEIAHLRTLFDGKIKGFEKCANKFIKIDYEHILGIDLTFSRRGMPDIGGFHHDFMQTIQSSGVLEFVDQVTHAHGFYQATLKYNGKIAKRNATFFSSNWTREKVVRKIFEAYENFLKKNITPPLKNGKYKIQGLIDEGIEIEIYLTQNGKITTAYPIFK